MDRRGIAEENEFSKCIKHNATIIREGMEVIKESYIEIHSAPTVLPYNIVNESESFGLFTIKLNKTSIQAIPFHFVFTIDTTLSMTESSDGHPSKMVYMQKTMIGMLKYLMDIDPNVYITIQTFNTKVKTIVNDLLLSKASITCLIDKIYGLVPDNSTNIQIALEYANKTIHSNFDKYPTHQHVHIFMTDGNANIGVTSPDILRNLIVDLIPNIFIGFGKDHNSEMLRKFSECKNAEYYFVDNLENASLVYAESIHNILYGAMRNVEFRIINGQLYDYSTNKWTSVLYENILASECHKYYQLKTSDKENVEIHIVGKNISFKDIEYESTVKVLPDLYISVLDDDEEFLPVDLSKYAYRKKVQELMYLAQNVSLKDEDDLFQDYYDPNDSANIKKDLKEVFKAIQLHMKENDLMEDGLLKMLCEDIYVTNKSLNNKNSSMYVSARQTSQGRQRSYNVGKTIDYNDIPFPKLRRQNTDLDHYTMGNDTTTCFASPTMVDTFNDVTICTQDQGHSGQEEDD
jgi:hypothetical protein